MKVFPCHSNPTIGLRARCVTGSFADVVCPGGSLQIRLERWFGVRVMTLILMGMDVECRILPANQCLELNTTEGRSLVK